MQTRTVLANVLKCEIYVLSVPQVIHPTVLF